MNNIQGMNTKILVVLDLFKDKEIMIYLFFFLAM